MKKNIVCKLSLNGSPSSEFSGMCSSLASVNEGILIWNEKEKPAWDMFYEYSPDMLICLDKDLSKAASNAANEYKNTKIVVFGADFNPEFRVDLVCDKEIDDSSQSMRLLPSANIVDFNHSSAKHKEKYATEVLILEEKLNEIMNAMHQFNMKIFSLKDRVYHQNYIGTINPKTLPSAISSCNVFADLSGNSDMICNVMAMKVPCLSATNCFIESEYMPIPANLEDFMNYLRTLLYKEEFAKKHAAKCYDYILSNYTYFHRASELYEKLGYDEFSKESLDIIKNYL